MASIPSASMEPGHEDREYQIPCLARERNVVPQWSPVMKTGNTRANPGMDKAQKKRLNGARS